MNTPYTHPSEVTTVRNALTHRRSVRSFSGQAIDDKILNDLITAAKYAPSGSNWQNQRFLVITEPEEIARIGSLRFVWPYKNANQDRTRENHPGGIIGKGTALILVFADAAANDARGNGEYHIWETLEIQNCSASIQNILTLATAYKLGTCWISASEKMNHTRLLTNRTWAQALSAYNIPPSYKAQGIIVLGHPKATDDLGYAKGERMHGATNWTSTDRKENEHYLIKKKQKPKYQTSSLPKRIQLSLSIRSKIISYCLKIIKHHDRRIHKIERRQIKNHYSSNVEEMSSDTQAP